MSDERTPGNDGAVSVRVSKDGWRAHVPTGVITAVMVALHLMQAPAQEETKRELGEMNTRISRIEGALGVRTSMVTRPSPASGAEGAGGTGALAGVAD